MAKKSAPKTKPTKKPTKGKKAKSLTCSKGYTFKNVGKNQVALMRNNGGGGAGVVTFECFCGGGGGGCTVAIDPKDGTKLACYDSGPDMCAGSCMWKIHIPGLPAPVFIA
jgi:hypothetical protein